MKRKWYEPTPAGDGGEPSMFASPLLCLAIVVMAASYAAIGWAIRSALH